jgi:hypothetical protein
LTAANNTASCRTVLPVQSRFIVLSRLLVVVLCQDDQPVIAARPASVKAYRVTQYAVRRTW